MAGVYNRINKSRAKNGAQNGVASTTRADVVHPDNVEMKPASDGFKSGIGKMAAPTASVPGVPAEQKSESELRKIFDTARRNQVAGMSYEEAMKRGDISPAEYVRRMAEKAQADGRELNAYETTLKSMYATDDLTPDQKRKSEKLDALGRLIGGVGDVVANVINTRAASRYGVAMDLHGMQKERQDRMERIKAKREALMEKQKEILGQAALGEVAYKRKLAEAKAERDARAAERDAERKYQADKLAETRAYEEAKVKEQRAYQSEEAEKSRRHQATESARSRAYQREERDRTKSSVVGKDGYTYTFTRPLEEHEIQRLLHNSPEGKEVIKQLTSIQVDNNDNEKKYIDWNQAFALAQANGWIDERDLVSMGGRKSGTRATRSDESKEKKPANPSGAVPSFVKSVPNGGMNNSYWTKGYPNL